MVIWYEGCKLNMKKICFFVGNIDLPGGAERVTSVIANGLSETGHTVVLLSLFKGKSPFFDLNPAIKLYQIFPEQVLFRKFYFTVVHQLRKFLSEYKIDVLVDVESILAAYALPAVIGMGVRHICWEHLNYKNDLDRSVRKIARHLAAIFADDVITLTRRDKEVWCKHTWMRANILAISNPIPFDIPDHSPNPNSTIALAVGRLTHVKGFDNLLKAWALIAMDVPPGWRLRIVGEGEDEQMLKALCCELGLNERVEFCPPTKNIGQHYSEASFCCLTSRYEGLPMVLIEAQAYGLSAIAFDCETGPREIINDLESGYLVRPGDVSDFSRKMYRLIVDKNMREKFSIKAKENSFLFSDERIIKQWNNLIG